MNKRKTMLWLFGTATDYKYRVITQTGSYCEPTVIKVWVDDCMIYTVDYDTYEKWYSFYRLSAREVVDKIHTDKFQTVYVYDVDFFYNMNNLSI